MKKNIGALILVIIAFVVSCKKPYNPPYIASANSYLVVEGVINSGSVQTVIKVSRTVNLSTGVAQNPVMGAILAVQSDQNASYPLTETSPGTYTSLGGLNLDNSHKYRLSIKTSDDKQYLSDLVAVENSPPLDSINFTTDSKGLNLFSNTHDPNNNTRYYRWKFQETWIFHPAFSSYLKAEGDTIVLRNFVDDNIYTCWRSDSSSTIILNSSAKLSKDVISENPLTSISSTSEKLGSKYSILVTQYALSGGAYSFWQNLKKNTEQLGSIFDAQPSQIAGNIHSLTNPAEPVIGYISVGATSSLRIFITNQQLPNWVTTPEVQNCKLDTFLYAYYPPGSKTAFNQVAEYLYNSPGHPASDIPVNAISRPGSPPLGYSGSIPECVDCTLRGTNVQPAFWK